MMKNYHCYYCNDQLLMMINDNAEDVNHNVSIHSFILTYFLCTNSDCETTHIEESDINGNLLFYGPLQDR
ncbi:hypothetical protein GH741_02680 [Aquibacillus halophilus]|uniref:Uncharacterized protein n=1 Tax=Aquibacillus halophilus TaxID=930132 RepID=A0A6A8DFE0_9BACI|nr:hypothetical protein [Aquibacillus halophilus]MRH41577.1 hypothetical protein [Aquibacillus halophilus]